MEGYLAPIAAVAAALAIAGCCSGLIGRLERPRRRVPGRGIASRDDAHARASRLVDLARPVVPRIWRLKDLGWIVAFVAVCAAWSYEVVHATRHAAVPNDTGIWICPILG